MCVRGLYQARKGSRHVFVLGVCTKPGKEVVMYLC
jgi:hypothetical protein